MQNPPEAASTTVRQNDARTVGRRSLIIAVLLGLLCGLLIGGAGVWIWLTQQQQAIEQATRLNIATLQQDIAARDRVIYNMDAASVQYPPQADCKLHSVNSDQSTTVVFRNTSKRLVNLFWLNFDGKEESFGTLQPGDALVEPTFVTHPWCVRDGANNIILSMTADKVARLVEIP